LRIGKAVKIPRLGVFTFTAPEFFLNVIALLLITILLLLGSYKFFITWQTEKTTSVFNFKRIWQREYL